jgi:ABC-type multidrug transport system fused ATPase/permease subunit
MFKKVLEYAGVYRKTTYAAIAAMFVGLVASVVPFFLAYQILRPILMREGLALGTAAAAIVVAVAVCGVLYALPYLKGGLKQKKSGGLRGGKSHHHAVLGMIEMLQKLAALS